MAVYDRTDRRWRCAECGALLVVDEGCGCGDEEEE